MKITWQQIEPGFRKAPTPDSGRPDLWMQWFRESWCHLENAGLTKVQAGLDVGRVKLRAVTLVWLAFDCVAYRSDYHTQQIYDNEELEWSHLLDSFDIEGNILVMLAITTGVSLQAEMVVEECCSPLDRDFEKYEPIYEDEDWVKFLRLLAYEVASQDRETVAKALCGGFGGFVELALSMFLPASDSLYDASCKVIDEIYDLEEKLEDPECEDAYRYKARIQNLRDNLNNDDYLLRLAREDLFDRFEVDEFQHKLAWFTEHCPVLIVPTA